jgi:hypothetical protein
VQSLSNACECFSCTVGSAAVDGDSAGVEGVEHLFGDVVRDLIVVLEGQEELVLYISFNQIKEYKKNI